MPAFPPDDALAALLPRDVADDPTRLRHPEAIDVWHGAIWARLGRADLAWAWWDQVTSDVLRPWVAAEQGRVLRELGLHREAEALELAGLEAASDIVDVVMLRLGLTADAVGRGDAPVATMRWQAVEPLVAALPDSPRGARQRLRSAWVEIEIAWLTGDEPSADGLPRWDEQELQPDYPPDYDHGSAYHRAKGLLFGGIVHDDSRLLDLAAGLAPPMLRWAVELARADRGVDGAMEAARETWTRIFPPPGLEHAVARTTTARRLTRPVEPAPSR